MNWMASGWKPANPGIVAVIDRTVAGHRRRGKRAAGCRRHNARMHLITAAAAVLASFFLGPSGG
jgi:hypothetical protein